MTDAVREFIRRGIRIETVINRMVFDGTTTDPMQQAVRDLLIAFMAATAQAQAEVTKEAQKAGIAHALANDDGTKYRGRKPTFTCDQFARARELLNQGLGISAVAKTVGLKRQSVYRIRSQPEKQMAALQAWYPEDFAQPSVMKGVDPNMMRMDTRRISRLPDPQTLQHGRNYNDPSLISRGHNDSCG